MAPDAGWCGTGRLGRGNQSRGRARSRPCSTPAGAETAGPPSRNPGPSQSVESPLQTRAGRPSHAIASTISVRRSASLAVESGRCPWSIARLLVGRPFLRAFRTPNPLEPERPPRAAPAVRVPDKWFVLAAMSGILLAGMTGVTAIVSCFLLGFSFDTIDPNSEKASAVARACGVLPCGFPSTCGARAALSHATPIASSRFLPSCSPWFPLRRGGHEAGD